MDWGPGALGCNQLRPSQLVIRNDFLASNICSSHWLPLLVHRHPVLRSDRRQPCGHGSQSIASHLWRSCSAGGYAEGNSADDESDCRCCRCRKCWSGYRYGSHESPHLHTLFTDSGLQIGDLKTGYLLRAAPRAQFLAQIIGSVVSIVLNVAIFVLFTRAAPCILTGEQPCTYGAPSVAAWSAVAVGVTSPELPVPPSSARAAIIFAVMASLTVVAKVSAHSCLYGQKLQHDSAYFHTGPISTIYPQLERHWPWIRGASNVLLHRDVHSRFLLVTDFMLMCLTGSLVQLPISSGS